MTKEEAQELLYKVSKCNRIQDTGGCRWCDYDTGSGCGMVYELEALASYGLDDIIEQAIADAKEAREAEEARENGE